MSIKNRIKLYEAFHHDKHLQKKVINDDNFTYRELIRIMKPYLNGITTVLDIGSGVGTVDFYLASKGKQVTGIEISKNATDIAKMNAISLNLDKEITFINATFPNRIPKKKYDLVIFSEVIEHLEDDAKALRDIWKIVKPGGILIITTPSVNAPLYRLGLLHDFDKRVGHLRRYNLDNLSNLVIRSGFQILKTGSHEGILRNYLFTNNFAGVLLKFIRWKISTIISLFDFALIQLFGSSNIYLVARKVSK